MIEIFKNTDDKLVRIDDYEKDCWINLTHPSGEEINFLINKFDIPRDFLTDPLDIDEVARLEIDDDNYIALSRIPIHDMDEEGSSFTTIPMGIIVIKDSFMLTVASRENDLINDFINERIKKFNPSDRTTSILQIFNRTNQLYIKYLKQLRHKASEIESDILKTLNEKDLVQIFNLHKSLILFTASLNSNNRMIQKLKRSKLFVMNEEQDDILEDITIDIKQAIEMAEIYGNILGEMMRFFSSLISNNLNIVMKFLTAITIIIAIPTLVSSIYGMNVELPFQTSAHAFLITMGISVLAVFLGILIFIYRKWL
ncbi:MAG: magnesium transporter CorA family protein [Candidatus Delongbacteria bacterium]|nr:magnesium transporter CorA family protein [Candidatus Delongbacteria bacterium]MCG2761380.1 magnesium transporter CorA family protein [Candidatus Delongbacteria bacterium]